MQMRRSLLGGIAAESGQMSVELAIAMPILLVAFVIALDGLAFIGECGRFDHVAAQAVLAQGASAGSGSYSLEARSANIKASIEEAMGTSNMRVAVTVRDAGGFAMWKKCAFTCKLEMCPWPFSSADFGIAGVRVPTVLAHEYSLCVEPYTPGKVL